MLGFPPHGEPMKERARILVVDDELGPRESLRMILKPSYDVHTAADGMGALEFLEKNSVDLITLDLKMPGLSGMELLEKIRKSNPDFMIIMITGYGTFRTAVEAIRLSVFDYISKPFNVTEIMSVVGRCLEMRSTRLAVKEAFQEIASLSDVPQSESQSARVIEKLQELFGDTQLTQPGEKNVNVLGYIAAVSGGIEKRDPYMMDHSERVRYWADLMAQKLDLSQTVHDGLQIASHLHDIGKVCISNRFMNGGERLSSTDWAVFKTHPAQSVELASPLNLPKNTVSAIQHHHERFDGTGYPEGLAGTDIPLEARIISIANTFVVLTSKMPYREAMNPVEAIAEIERNTNTHFDSDLIPIFLEITREVKSRCPAMDTRKGPAKEAS
jgi:putative two-component system response regulator